MKALQASARRLTDVRVYEEELADWLPEQIIDCHVHIGLDRHIGPISPDRLRIDWAMRLGLDQTWSQLRERFELLFPSKQVRALAFGNIYREADTDQSNAYIYEGIGREDVCAGALYVTRPEWPAEKVARALANGFVGIKPYPDLAPQGPHEARIHDFLPHHHLAELNRVGGILMLHLPRPGRLADEHNIRDLIDIAAAYPNVDIIVAHVGRAYCLPTAVRGLPHLADCETIRFDIAANLNSEVFSLALRTVGPERLLFGSDLPITSARGAREHEGETYINHLELPEIGSDGQVRPAQRTGYTFLLYEELRALIKALKETGHGKEAMRQILYSNCTALLDRAAGRASGSEAQIASVP